MQVTEFQSEWVQKKNPLHYYLLWITFILFLFIYLFILCLETFNHSRCTRCEKPSYSKMTSWLSLHIFIGTVNMVTKQSISVTVCQLKVIMFCFVLSWGLFFWCKKSTSGRKKNKMSWLSEFELTRRLFNSFMGIYEDVTGEPICKKSGFSQRS